MKMFLKQGFGCLLTACLTAASFFVVTVAVGMLIYYLGLLFSVQVASYWFGLVAVLALLGSLLASPMLRHLYHHLKWEYLKRRGIAVQATVTHQKSRIIANARGAGGYQCDLTLRWQHPETEQTYEYECHYSFVFGLSRKERALFEGDYRRGAHLPLVFSPKHPQLFVVEIPFVPIWFDVLF
jgi:hypothetical protein